MEVKLLSKKVFDLKALNKFPYLSKNDLLCYKIKLN